MAVHGYVTHAAHNRRYTSLLVLGYVLAFEVIGACMDLCAVRLRDDWAQRELKLVVRDQSQLSSTGRLVLNHLRAAEQSEMPFLSRELPVSQLRLDSGDTFRAEQGAAGLCGSAASFCGAKEINK